TFQPEIATDLASIRGFTLGDVNGDGKIDVVTPGIITAAVALGNGDATFTPAQYFGLEGSEVRLTVADVNGDSHADIIGAGFSGTIVVVIGLGNGDFIAARNFAFSAAVGASVIADFNGDGFWDAASVSPDVHNQGSVILGN